MVTVVPDPPREGTIAIELIVGAILSILKVAKFEVVIMLLPARSVME